MQLTQGQLGTIKTCEKFGGEAGDCAAIVDELRDHISDLQSEHESEMDKLKDRISELEGENEDLQKELDSARES